MFEQTMQHDRVELLEQLMHAANMPLARLPRVGLRHWIAFFRGKAKLDGVPIPKDELQIGSLLKPALEHATAPALQITIGHLLTWCADHTREVSFQTKVRDTQTMSVLLNSCPPLQELFELTGDSVEFEASLPEATRIEISSFVRKRYRPFIRI